MSYEHVAITRRDGIVELRFHTDGDSLVWSAGAHRELGDAFAEVGADPTTKVVIVTGTGETFCARTDTESFIAAGAGWDIIWWEGKRLLKNLLDIDALVIGAVNGPAFIHAELGVLADIVLASSTAVFADKTHFQRGGVPGDGVHLVWPELLGTARASYFLLTGQEIDAHEAERIGFVNEVLAPDRLSPRAWELAGELATRAVETLRFTRDALNIERRARFANALSHGLLAEGLRDQLLMPRGE
jgi:enoyl-CoA hydratase/carnithine racemase